MKKFIVETSARHVHLTQKDVDILFGKGYSLTVAKWLSQPGQFLCNEKVIVKGPKKTFERVGIIGPVRKVTQFELSKTDCISCGIQPVLRDSGQIENTPGFEVCTELASIKFDKGAIVAKRHIHMTPIDAHNFGVVDGQEVSVLIDNGSGRKAVLGETTIRVDNNYALAMHIDTDESNAVFADNDTYGSLLDLDSLN